MSDRSRAELIRDLQQIDADCMSSTYVEALAAEAAAVISAIPQAPDTRTAYHLRELIGLIDEYEAMPCASLRKRLTEGHDAARTALGDAR